MCPEHRCCRLVLQGVPIVGVLFGCGDSSQANADSEGSTTEHGSSGDAPSTTTGDVTASASTDPTSADTSGSSGAEQGSGSTGHDGGSETTGTTGEPPTYSIRLVFPPGTNLVAIPTSMNDAATVVGYTGPEPWSPMAQPIRIDFAGAASLLETPEANWGYAHGIGDDDTIVGEFAWRPQLWRGGLRKELVIPEGWGSAVARGVNRAGIVAGSYADYDDALPPNPVGPRPCTWADATAVPDPLPPLESEYTVGAAFAINEDGMIAGYMTSSVGTLAVRWVGLSEVPEALSPLENAILCEARGINALGDAVGRCGFEDGNQAFFAAADGSPSQGLPFLVASRRYAEAFGVDDLGRVVGTAGAADGTVHAVLWANGQILDLNERLVDPPPELGHLSSAVALDSSGRIAAEAMLSGSGPEPGRAVALLEPMR